MVLGTHGMLGQEKGGMEGMGYGEVQEMGDKEQELGDKEQELGGIEQVREQPLLEQQEEDEACRSCFHGCK